MSKELYILRHAKSDWTTDAPNDFQRPLNDRGERNARKMGKWMAEHGIEPQVVVSSPALRAWQTATLACHALGVDETQIYFKSELYLADLGTLLEAIHSLPNEAESAMLVGHNPGLDQLVDYLADSPVPSSPDGKVMATATIAEFVLDNDWQTLAEGDASLSRLHRAR